MRQALSLTLLLVLAATLYGVRLNAPEQQPEERELASQAQQLATPAGRDVDGRLSPAVVHAPPSSVRRARIPVYANALLMKLLSDTSINVRWAAVACGCVTVLLMYAVGLRVFHSERLALASALFLLLTPAHFTFSRSAIQDSVWLLPFVSLWLLGLSEVSDPSSVRSRSWILAMSVIALACAIYTQPSGAIGSALLAPLTLLVVVGTEGARPRHLWMIGGAVLAVASALLAWLAMYRPAYLATAGRWLLHPEYVWQLLTNCSGIFWDFLSPSQLFLNPGAPGFVGMFLSPVVVLIVVGLYEAARRGRAIGMHRVALLGFFVGPLVTAALRDPRATRHALVMLPFAVLLAVLGLATLSKSTRYGYRLLALVLITLVPIQFAIAYRGLALAIPTSTSSTHR